MIIKNTVKAASLLAVLLLAAPALAGTATYLGSDTASDVQIDGTLLAGFAIGPADVTYGGGTITIQAIDNTGFSGLQLPDSANNGIQLTGDGTFTVVIDSINFDAIAADAGFVGIYLDETGGTTSQVFFGITPNGSGGLNAGLGIPGSDETVANQAGFTLPATIVLTRVGANVSATVNSVDFGSVTMPNPAVAHFTRIYLEPRSQGDPIVSFTSIEVDGVGIPNVNFTPPPVGPTVTITRDGAIDSAFTSGSATWSVEFSEDVQFVTDDDFEIVTGGDAAFTTGPDLTVNGPESYTVAVGGVTGSAGSVTLNFLGNDVVSVETGLLAPAVLGQLYTNVPLPAAKDWVLILMAVVLVLAATVVIRKRALKH